MATETQTETETETKSTNEWRQREMGALWRREGKSQNYLSGYVKIGAITVTKRKTLRLWNSITAMTTG